jgi:sugar phosphate isomerase/epimerase
MSAPLLAFSTLAFPGVTLAEAVSFGRACGYAGVELRLVDGALIDPAMPAADRAAVRLTTAAAGLPIVAVDSSVRLTGDDPGPQLRGFLELASDCGAPLVRVFGGPVSPDRLARRAQLERAARALDAAAGQAERLGVAIGVETHDAFSASSLVAELLAMVESPSVGAVWDSHHPHRTGEPPAEVYRNIGGRLLLAQVKDARREPGAPDGWRLTLLGQGEVPVREIIDLLAAGYPGWISVEWEKHWHPEIEEPQVALPQYYTLLSAWLADRPETG